MKKSSKVDLGIVAALALSLVGCQSNHMQRCVDDGNNIFSDQFCNPGFTARYRWTTDPTGRPSCVDANNRTVNDTACNYTVGRRYHWYYGGRGNYALGSAAYGGSEAPSSGARYATASEARSGSSHGGTTRGGFGRAAAGGRGA